MDQDDGTQRLAAAVRRVLPQVRGNLEQLVRIPSVSADPAAAPHMRASAAAVRELLLNAGLSGVEILTAAGGQPAVTGHRAGPPGAPTVLLYAHHDVQPSGDRGAWESDPFQPEERNGRLYGRGTADDKAGIAVHLAALLAHGGELPVSVTVLVEGEEEIGSPTIAQFLAAYSSRLAADVVVLADSANWAADTPAVTTSLRGGVNVTVQVRTLDHGVHSGLYGGPVPDALTALSRLLATLHDERGDVAVAGLATAAVGPLSLADEELRADSGLLDGVELIGTGSLAERLWAKPAIAVTGIDAPAVEIGSNTLVPVARAKVSLRIAPGDDPAAAAAALGAHLESHAPWGAQVTVTPGSKVAPYSVRAGGRAYDAAHCALAAAWGRPAVDMGVGGSISFVSAYAALVPDAEILLTGVEDPGTRAHGPNESLDLAVFERACIAEALLLRNLSLS